ncbi:MAG: VWA domain-containing protein [Ruminococcaceae bacterium]|nr:VWA domain-containing protein [Oscillospiraceae bacterium]
MEKTKTEILAEEILLKAKTELTGNIHSLIRAINALQFVPTNEEDVFTDAKSFYYNPQFILLRFKEDTSSVNRVLLHSILHCMLLHPFNIDFKDTTLWNLSADICVENIINNWNLNSTKSHKEAAQSMVINDISKSVKNLSAENIYYYLKGSELSQETIKYYSDLFSDDVHKIWYKNKNFAFFEFDDDEETVEARSIYKKADNRKGLSNESNDKIMYDAINGSAEEEKELWRKITPTVESDIEALKNQGLMSGVETAVLKGVSRDKYDYSKFLKKLISIDETIEINDDEFDYIFYTYGLNTYKNMPIIEPLEYAENAKVKKLFIAIDTSGSVKGEQVEKFIEKTYNILKSTDFFGKSTEVHIIQCDSEIKEIKILKSSQEIEEYIKNISLKGFGGTDFRPVFKYVDEIFTSSQKNEVNGLIYFTDGDGIYPKQMPKFKSLFVINDSCFDKSKMPLWAISLFLDSQDLIG